MFIHFNSDNMAQCDNCDQTGTIVSISGDRRDHSLIFCIQCFRQMFNAFCLERKNYDSKTESPARRIDRLIRMPGAREVQGN